MAKIKRDSPENVCAGRALKMCDCTSTPGATIASKTLWSLTKFRCEFFCSLWSLKSLMTYNSIMQTHLKEPYAFSRPYRQPYQIVNSPIHLGHIAETVLLVR